MEEELQFGNRLRALRSKAGLTLRELARRINIDFTYISKLENGQLPPPSEPVISRLAEVLDADREELLQIAGRVPADIAEILKKQAKQEFGSKIKELRKKARLTQQEVAERVGINATYLSKIENGVMLPPTKGIIVLLAEVLRTNKDELVALAGKTPVNIAKIRKRLNAGSQRRFSMPKISLTPTLVFRAALVMFLVIAFSASLWYAAPTPVKAIDINITNPSTATAGGTYTFTFRVDVQDTDLLPIQSVDLRIYKAVGTGIYTVTYTNLPLPTAPSTTESRNYANTGGGAATITGVTGPGWGYNYGYRYGYGYGYQNQIWETINLGYGYGYGYGSGSYVGSAYINYTVVWLPPSTWSTGTYNIQAIVYGTSGDGSKAFTNDATATFTLSGAAEGGGGGGGGGGATGVTRVYQDSAHRFTEDVTAPSDDGLVVLKVSKGARGETATGQGLTTISIKKMTSPPALPADTNRVGLVYDLKPDGAQFPDGATLTMKYDAAAVKGGTMVMAYWNGSAWVDLDGPFQIDAVNHTISAKIYHFTPFSVIEYVKPAAFTASKLTISPASVKTGEAATIGVTITNTGDISGTYDVILRVNNVVAETKTVTVAAHSSLEVSFALSQNTAGIYTIGIDGLSGTLTVNALPTPTLTPTPTPKPTPTPTPKPTPTPTPTPKPTPTPTPTLAAPEEGISPWLIGGIIAVVVIIGIIALVILARRKT